jgi:hypothetical protein
VDAFHVPYSSISPQLYVGEDPVLQNMSRTVANESKMVIYGSSSPSGELRRYGIATENTGGYYIGFERNTTPGGGPKIIDTVYYMNATDGNASEGGDSGGPIYMGMNVTISGRTDYQAFIVGITNGNKRNLTTGELNTVFGPESEINYNLNVRPYWSRTTILT